MNKYCITGAVGTNTIVGTAASKAPQDVCNILSNNGYKNIFLTVNQKENAIKRLIKKHIQLRRIIKQIPENSIVLIQYPIYKYLFLPLLYKKKCRTQLLIHDLDSIRTKGKLSFVEKLNLRSFDDIIVHTEEMKKVLERYVNGKIYVLNCFDYLLEDYHNYGNQRVLSKEICFAGNIDKSYYLSSLINGARSLTFRLYGSWDKKTNFTGNYTYEGKFHPDKVGFLKGSWGLVWDGNTIETCGGTWGDYLKIIASHKISLYIVAGLPLIVWNNSAMSPFVKKHKIGITVNSLYELDKKINSITEDEYKLFIHNLNILAQELIKGQMIENVINRIKDDSSSLYFNNR